MKLERIIVDTDIKTYNVIDIMQYYSLILQVDFLKNGNTFIISDYDISIEMLKGDNTFIIQNDNYEIIKNEKGDLSSLRIICNNDLTRISGNGKLQIKLINKENIITGSWIIDINILKSAIEDNSTVSQNIMTEKEQLEKFLKDAEDLLTNCDFSQLLEKINEIEKNDTIQFSKLTEHSTQINEINDRVKILESEEPSGQNLFKNTFYNLIFNSSGENGDLEGWTKYYESGIFSLEKDYKTLSGYSLKLESENNEQTFIFTKPFLLKQDSINDISVCFKVLCDKGFSVYLLTYNSEVPPDSFDNFDNYYLIEENLGDTFTSYFPNENTIKNVKGKSAVIRLGANAGGFANFADLMVNYGSPLQWNYSYKNNFHSIGESSQSGDTTDLEISSNDYKILFPNDKKLIFYSDYWQINNSSFQFGRDVKFPTAFPNGILNVIICGRRIGNEVFGLKNGYVWNVSKTGFSFTGDMETGKEYAINCLAIGY